MTDVRSFRAETLEEALQMVHDELGPGAIVVRQREGVIGGIGGFFAKQCVELDVEAPSGTVTRVAPAVPARHVVDLYAGVDDDIDFTFAAAPTLAEPVASASAVAVAVADEPTQDLGPLVETLLQQASPFAGELAEALEEWAPKQQADPEPEFPFVPDPLPELLAEPEAEPQALSTLQALPEPLPATVEPEPEFGLELIELELLVDGELKTVEAEPVPGTDLVPTAEAELPMFLTGYDTERIASRLMRLGLPERTAQDVVAEAENELRIFDPVTPFESHVRSALARRIKVARSAKKRRRVVALVGPPGSGKTLAAARLLHAHQTCGGRTVGALSLAPVRDALELADRTRELDVEFAAAYEPDALEHELESLEPVDLLVVDTPGVDPSDADRLATLGYLLELVGADETHLLVPADLGSEGVRTLVEAFAPAVGADRLMLTHLDGRGDGAGAVSASIALRIPISFTAVGSSWGLRPADSIELASLVLP
jgi:flagellar biosynthesis GTPase FlhF